MSAALVSDQVVADHIARALAPLSRSFKVGQVWQTRDGKDLFRVIAITEEPVLPVIVRSLTCSFTSAVSLDGRETEFDDDLPSRADLVTLVRDVA